MSLRYRKEKTALASTDKIQNKVEMRTDLEKKRLMEIYRNMLDMTTGSTILHVKTCAI